MRRRTYSVVLFVVSGVMTPWSLATADVWRLVPSVGVQELYNSTSSGAQGNTRPDIVTQLTPGFSVTGDTAHSTINLNYTPSFNHYDTGTSPDRLDQNLNGGGTFTPFPEYLTIDFQTSASETAGNGNFSNSQSGLLVPTNDLLLYYVGKIIPHFSQHFSDVATVDAYYRLTSTNTSDQGTHAGGSSLSNSGLAKDAEIIFGSGESFGRMNAKLDFDHADNTGSGNLSTNDRDVLELNYHLAQAYSLTGTFGYQGTHYPQSASASAYNQEGITWTLGVTATPNDASMIAVTYGLQQGIYTPSLEMSYVPDPLTTIRASYLVTVQNQLQTAAQNLQYLTYDLLGNPIDSRTGLPFNLVNQTFGSQNVLFRDKPALLSLSHEFLRSNVSVTATYEVRSSVSGVPSNDTAWGGTISYSRNIRPDLVGNINIGYQTHTTTGAPGTSSQITRNINATASLNYTINEKTTFTLTESYLQAASNIRTSDTTTNQLTVGLRREF